MRLYERDAFSEEILTSREVVRYKKSAEVSFSR